MFVTEIAPRESLAPFVRGITIVEAEVDAVRTLIPSSGVVLGLRYRGRACELIAETSPLPNATLTGIRRTARRMWTAGGSGAIFIHFREAGASAFFPWSLDALAGTTLDLEQSMLGDRVRGLRADLAEADDHRTRISIVEEFLHSQQQTAEPDPLVLAAVRAIAEDPASIRIDRLARHFDLGRDRLEKRFRRVVGTSPKQLASILRLRRALTLRGEGVSLTTVSVEAGYFDQSHFIRDFRSFTGEPPQKFFRHVEHC